MKHADEDMDDLRRLYAQAPDEEPPAALDAAILSRARSAVQASSSRTIAARWGAPLATAAVLVLSVIVVINVQREQPEVLSVTGPAREAPAPASPPAPAPAISAAAESRAPVAVQPAAEPQQDAGEEPGLGAPAAEVAPQPAPEPAARPAAPVPRAASRLSLRADSARSEGAMTAAKSTAAMAPEHMTAESMNQEQMTPEQWLAHLVELRTQGRLKEFQDSLAEFRKRFPAHTVPEALLRVPAPAPDAGQER